MIKTSILKCANINYTYKLQGKPKFNNLIYLNKFKYFS